MFVRFNRPGKNISSLCDKQITPDKNNNNPFWFSINLTCINVTVEYLCSFQMQSIFFCLSRVSTVHSDAGASRDKARLWLRQAHRRGLHHLPPALHRTLRQLPHRDLPHPGHHSHSNPLQNSSRSPT